MLPLVRVVTGCAQSNRAPPYSLFFAGDDGPVGKAEDVEALTDDAHAPGLARDCPRYSGGRHQRFETDASRALPLPDYC